MGVNLEKLNFDGFKAGNESDPIIKNNILSRIARMRALLIVIPTLTGCMNAQEGDFEQDEYVYSESDGGSEEKDIDADNVSVDAGSDVAIDSADETDAGEMNVREVEKELQNSEYAKILENYENLQGLREKLLTTYVELGGNEYDTWYRMVLNFLVNDYDPNQNFEDFVDSVRINMPAQGKPDSTFLLRVAHSLWLEQSGNVNWSLKDYSKEEIDYLFATNGLYTGEAVEIDDAVSPYGAPRVKFFDQNDIFYRQDPYREAQVEEDMAYQLFPIARKLVGDDVDETVRNVVRWSKNNFFHFDSDYSEAVYEDGREPAEENDFGENYRPANLKRFFEERAEGCHGPALLVADMLKVLNIPAHNYQAITSHGVVYIPVLDRFVHGDHISGYQSAFVEDQLIKPEDIKEAVLNGDEMMTEYLASTQFCDGDAGDGTFCPCRSLKRVGEFLTAFSFGGAIAESISAECLANYQREMVSYDFEMLEESGHKTLMSYPMPIKGLVELADPDKEIW